MTRLSTKPGRWNPGDEDSRLQDPNLTQALSVPSPLCDVLVIDDEPVVRQAVRRILEEEGLRVSTAPDAASALAHDAAATCRMVLCDLKLPDRPGTEVAARLREARPRLPIVLTTGLVTPENLSEAIEAVAGDLLLKPFDEAELLAAVRGALRSADGRREEKRP